MILNSTKRFLLSELDRIEASINWIDVNQNPSLAAEYQRRQEIVTNLLNYADTPEMIQNIIDQRIQEMKEGLTHSSDTQDINDMLTQRDIDIEYLDGLRARLSMAVTNGIFHYALANVKRL